MRRSLAVLLLILLLIFSPSLSYGQVHDETGAVGAFTPDRAATGTIAALDATVTVSLTGRMGVGVYISTSNLNATVVPEISMEATGTNFSATTFIKTDATTPASVVFSGGSDTQVRGIIVLPGTRRARIRISVYTSGTASATVAATDALGNVILTPVGGGGGTQDVNLKQVGGTAVSGSNVVDAGNTAFRVNCVAGCTPGGSFADASAFTFGTTAVSNTAFVVDDTATNTVAENSAGAARMSASRVLYANPRDASGNEIASATSQPAGTERGLIVREAQKGQQTMANSRPVVLPSDQTVTVAGAKSNNGGAPGSTNLGTLPALANAAAPTYTEGNQVALSTNLAGELRTTATASIPGTVTVVGTKDTNGVAPGSTNLGTLPAKATNAEPGPLTEGNQYPLFMNLSGSLRVVNGGQYVTTNLGFVNGTGISGTTVPVRGDKTSNGAAAGAENVSTIPAIATASNPNYTEGRQVGLSVDLTGRTRIDGTVRGDHQANVSAPFSDNVSVLPATATAASPINVEGKLTSLSMDLSGRTRVITSLSQPVAATAAWTSATALNTTLQLDVTNYATVALTYFDSPAITGGTMSFNVLDAASAGSAALCARMDRVTQETTFAFATGFFAWQCSVAGFTKFSVQLTGAITSGTANLRIQASPTTISQRQQSTIAGATGSDLATVKPPSTAAQSTDTSLVVALSPASVNGVTTVPSSASTANNDGACVSLTTTSSTVLASFSSRGFAGICSRVTNTDIVYLRLASTATTSDLPLEIGQCFNLGGPRVYTGVIDGRSSTGTQSVCVVEW